MRCTLICCVLTLITSAAIAKQKVVCHESPDYLIAEGATGQVGTHFLVKYKTKGDQSPNCDYIARPDDFEIRNEWAEYFMAIQGNLLILDSGTGPEARNLIFWDLEKKKKIHTTKYSDADLEPEYVGYWIETGTANDENCPEKKEWESSGLGSVIETYVRLNLKNFSVWKSTKTRCRAQQ